MYYSLIHDIKLLDIRYMYSIIKTERGNSYRKNEEISGRKAHTNTRKLN